MRRFIQNFWRFLRLPALWMLFVTHLIFGWYWRDEQSDVVDKVDFFHLHPQLYWVANIGLVLLLVAIWTTPSRFYKQFVGSWFDSDLLTFIFIIWASVMGVLLLTYFDGFTTTVILSSALLLVRLDLLMRGAGVGVTFALLSFFSLSGLISGAIAHWVYLEGMRTPF
jgi:hypothetical protein